MHAVRKALGTRALRIRRTSSQASMCAGACHVDVVDLWRVQSAGTACRETGLRSHGTVACSAFGFAGDQASYVHGASTQQLLGDTIGRNLAKTVQNIPDKLAVSSMHQKVSRTHKSISLKPKHVYDQDAVQKRLTYMEFSQAVEQVSRGLLGVGVKPGEAIRYCSDTSHLTCHHHLELLTHVITSACCRQTNSAATVQICCASGCMRRCWMFLMLSAQTLSPASASHTTCLR